MGWSSRRYELQTVPAKASCRTWGGGGATCKTKVGRNANFVLGRKVGFAG